MNMPMPARQRGLTMMGFLFVTVVVVIAALISFRVIPAYIEYFSVQKALEGALNDSKDLSRADVRRLVERRLGAEYIDSVHASDIEVDQVRQRDHGVGKLADQAASHRQRQHPAGVRRVRLAVARPRGPDGRIPAPETGLYVSAGPNCCARR